MRKNIRYAVNLFVLFLCIYLVNGCGYLNKSADNDSVSKKEAVDDEDGEEDGDEDVDKEDSKKKNANKKKKKGKGSEEVTSDELPETENNAGKNSFSKSNYTVQLDYAAAKIDSASYVFPDSDKRLLSDSEIGSASIWQLRRGTNEVYARHGRKFNNKGQAAYFAQKTWYNGTIEADSFQENTLNEYEKQNVKAMQNRLDSLVGNNNISGLEISARDFLSENGVNALLRCRFGPEYQGGIDPVEIAYQVADESVDYEKLSQEIMKNGFDIELDLSYISDETLKKFLNDNIAYPVEILGTYNTNVYVDGKQIYYIEHGDTNYFSVDHLELIDIKDDIITFLYLDENYSDLYDSNLVIELQKDKESFKFVSVRDIQK